MNLVHSVKRDMCQGKNRESLDLLLIGTVK